ncbi:MAG: YqgE/AlgH family protein [Bacteroidia bacterium]|nr:YqgE/AlgH family protein [Bacteroidia bacterium]
MRDVNFQRTVVLLTEHTETSSVGFVLNRRLKVNIGDIVSDMRSLDVPVFLGGPVSQNSLHFVHRLDSLPGCEMIYEGLYWGGSFKAIKELAKEGALQGEDIRFFVGYAGWGQGQLRQELEDKAWIVAPENTAAIFQTDHGQLWRQVLKNLGGKFQVISNYPVDPQLN